MKKSFIILVSLVSALVTPIIQADIVKVEITGQISYIIDDANVLGGVIAIGAPITGWYAYESDTAPSILETSLAHYKFYSAPCGMFLEIGDLKFETAIQNRDVLVQIKNDYPSRGDGFYMLSSNNVAVSEMPIERISWQLDDETGEALSSLELPTDILNLTDWQYNIISIDGVKTDDYGNKESLLIRATVTSATLVPEPTTIGLLFLGGLITLRRTCKAQ